MNQYPLIRGKTDLKTRFPEVAAQWDDEKNEGTGPEDVQPASMKKVWWRCPKGHSWRAAVYARTAGNGCPYCAGHTLNCGVNDLLTVAPEIAGQWDAEKNGSLGPQDVTAGNRRKAWWICPRGHSWEASIGSRVSGKGCPYCAGRKVMPGFNDLATADPDLAKQWNDEMNGSLTPHDVVGMSHTAVWWTGKCGHVWKATVANRRYGSGCPYCCGKKVLEGFNDAKSNYPEFIGEWDYEKNEFFPEQVSVSSQKEIWWKCSKGHSWKAKLPARRNGSGCPYCGNRRVAPGKTILHPGIRSSSKNGTMKETGGSCLKTLPINPVKRSGGSVRKDIPGKLKYITGQKERGVRSAPNWRTIILSRPGKPTWQRSAPDSRQNGITDGTGDFLQNRSGRFQQEKCGGSAAADIIGSVRSRSGSVGQGVRSAMEGSTDSQG